MGPLIRAVGLIVCSGIGLGCGPSISKNRLLTPASPRSEVSLPSGTLVFRDGSSLRAVDLDTAEQWVARPFAEPTSNIESKIPGGLWRAESDREQTSDDALGLSGGTFSPDGKTIAFRKTDASSPEDKVVVLDLQAETVRIVPVSSPGLEWLDTAHIDPVDLLVSGRPAACGELVIRRENIARTDRILLSYRASKSNPEALASTQDRVLVTSESRAQNSHFRDWDKQVWLGTPGFLTDACTHFAFSMGRSLYVGEVKTGKFTRIVGGKTTSLSVGGLIETPASR